MVKSVSRESLSKYYGAEGLNGHHKYAVIDGPVIYGLGETESSAMKDFKNTCHNAGVELGEYTLVEIT
jgi:hypothetical protein